MIQSHLDLPLYLQASRLTGLFIKHSCVRCMFDAWMDGLVLVLFQMHFFIWPFSWISHCLGCFRCVLSKDGDCSLWLELRSHLSHTLSDLRLDLDSRTGIREQSLFFILWRINIRKTSDGLNVIASCGTHLVRAATDDISTMSANATTAAALSFVISFACRNYTQGANKRIAKCSICRKNMKDAASTSPIFNM